MTLLFLVYIQYVFTTRPPDSIR